jgi:IclR family acetate operon transcriptional repressor
MTIAAGQMQTVNRVLDLLERIAQSGGTMGLTQLATAAALPLSTAHRITRSLVAAGYLIQEPNKQYSLGLRLVPLGDAANRRLTAWTTAQLRRLVDVTGETANAATLAGDSVLFVAQAQSPYSMRTSTEVGRRTMAHCSAVGKVLLSLLTDYEAVAILERTGTPARTPNTLTTTRQVLAELAEVRHRGFAVDDEEEEAGARCVAVPVAGAPVPLAISVSGPTPRVTPERLPALVGELRRAADRSGEDRVGRSA